MLASFLGDTDFRNGLVKYIKQYSYGNAQTADLWNSLSEVSGKDVQGMMQGWTKQTGFPLLTLEEDETAPEGVLRLKASQTRFLQTGPDANATALWPIPIDFVVAGQASQAPSRVFGERSGFIDIDLKSIGVNGKPAWLKFNVAQAAMYRVRYPPRLFAALCQAVKERDPLLTPADRLGVQSDAFSLTRCGLLSTVQLLELVRSYKNEDGQNE